MGFNSGFKGLKSRLSLSLKPFRKDRGKGKGKGKGKAIQLQAWTGPEGSRRMRLPDFKTIGTSRW